MTGLSPHGEAAVLAAITTVGYVSLHAADPGTSGGGEIVGNAYARQGPVAFTNTGSEPTVASNSAIVSYATASADWGVVGFFGVWDAASGGNFQGSGALDVPRTVLAGDQVRFLTGALTITAQ